MRTAQAAANRAERDRSGPGPGGSGGDERQVKSPRREESDEPRPREIGGVPGPDPTRYGDWERRGRCVDF